MDQIQSGFHKQVFLLFLCSETSLYLDPKVTFKICNLKPCIA